MADPIVDIRGVITTTNIVTDPEGKKKPFVKVELLQITKLGSNITFVKDLDLNRRYVPGQNVVLTCKSSTWSMNGKVGTSYSVFDGSFEDVSLGFGSSSSFDSKSDTKKVGVI